MTMNKVLFCVAIVCFLSSNLHADTIVGNTFDGPTNEDAFFSTGQVVDANVSFAGVSRPGYIPNNGTDVLVASELRTFATLLNFTRYFGFEISPISGAEINFDDFTYSGFTTLNDGATVGPETYQLRSNLDGFSASLGDGADSGGVFDLSGAQFQNVTAPIEFRLFIQSSDGAETSPNTSYSLDSFEFTGTTVAVPEPSTLAVVGLLGICGLTSRRRTSANQ